MRVAAVMVMAVVAEAAGREVATWVAEAMAQAGMGGAVIMVANSAKRAAVGWMGDRG